MTLRFPHCCVRMMQMYGAERADGHQRRSLRYALRAPWVG